MTRAWVYWRFAPRRGGGGMADALVSGASDRKVVEVQLLSAAPAL
jgi:hypothetical protein